MTTYYVLFCMDQNSTQHNVEEIYTSLVDAQNQMASCITSCIAECQAAFPSATVTSQVSNDGMASIVKYESTMIVPTVLNGEERVGLDLSFTNQMLYTSMYIITKN